MFVDLARLGAWSKLRDPEYLTLSAVSDRQAPRQDGVPLGYFFIRKVLVVLEATRALNSHVAACLYMHMLIFGQRQWLSETCSE